MKKIFIYAERSERKNYAQAIENCVAQPVFSKDILTADDCDALLLPGGGDIDPKIYGKENFGSVGIDRDLDNVELELIEKFVNSERPILGICRGLQIINVAFGGDLIQDIKTASNHKWEEKTGDKVHMIKTADSSFLRSIYGEYFPVNSAHHQAIKNIAPDFDISAKSDDGIIEAIENREKKIYAVQWHPERMAFRNRRNDTVDGRLVFDFFLNLLR